MCFLQNFPPCPVSQRAKSEHKKLPLGAHQLFLQCHEGFPLRSRALPVIEATTHRAHAANCSCPRGGEVGRTHCAAGSRATAWKCRNPQLLWGLPAYYTLSQKPFFFTKLGAFGSGFQPGYLLMHAARETSFLPASSSPAPPAGQAVLTQGGQRRADLAP